MARSRFGIRVSGRHAARPFPCQAYLPQGLRGRRHWHELEHQGTASHLCLDHERARCPGRGDRQARRSQHHCDDRDCLSARAAAGDQYRRRGDGHHLQDRLKGDPKIHPDLRPLRAFRRRNAAVAGASSASHTAPQITQYGSWLLTVYGPRRRRVAASSGATADGRRSGKQPPHIHWPGLDGQQGCAVRWLGHWGEGSRGWGG